LRIVRGQSSKKNFTVLPNSTLRDERLSFRARGVHAYLLSPDDGWETSSEEIARHGCEGRDAIRTALTELEAAGYIERVKVQDLVTGLWSTVVTVHERPQPRTDFQASVNQSSDNQPSVSQALIRSTNKKNPLPPATASQGPVCLTHRDGPGTSCRACGTSPRQVAAAQQRAAVARRRSDAQVALEAERSAAEAAAAQSDPERVAELVGSIRQAIRGSR
jgi:hypothetical protein